MVAHLLGLLNGNKCAHGAVSSHCSNIADVFAFSEGGQKLASGGRRLAWQHLIRDLPSQIINMITVQVGVCSGFFEKSLHSSSNWDVAGQLLQEKLHIILVHTFRSQHNFLWLQMAVTIVTRTPRPPPLQKPSATLFAKIDVEAEPTNVWL
jgi:hypothetical protein